MAQRSPSDSLTPRPVIQQSKDLLHLCEETIRKSKQYSTSGVSDSFVINKHQCDLLVNRLLGVEFILANIQGVRLVILGLIVAVLGELLETLLDAEKLIRASCVTTSDWPRAAIEQGDVKETFSKLLYEVKWCTDILLSILIMDRAANFPNTFGPEDCDGKLRREDECLRVLAVEKDEESLKDYLRNVKLADPTKKRLAYQLCEQMEASPPDCKLLFLDPKGFDRRGRVIGSGAFGVVQETTYLGTCPCAMKVIRARQPAVKDLFKKELDVIKELGHHPHLVRLFCHSQVDESFYLIMEKMDMDLAKAVVYKDLKLPLVKAVSLMLQIAEGVKYIHSKRVAHRDLKLENVLVKYDTSPTGSEPRICSVKIADFGLSKTKEASKTYSNQTLNTGTSWYMAPEVIKIGGGDPHKAKFNPRKADVYSFAIMCAVILNGKDPYDDCTELRIKQIKAEVKEGKRRPTLPADCPRRLDILIRKCWAGNPSERPLFDVICKELRYIKGLLLRGDMENLANVGFDALELAGVDKAKIEGPWGSGGGDSIKFIDVATSIRGIKLYCSAGRDVPVWSIEVTYGLFGISFTRKYGGIRYGNLEKEIVFDECEFITCISGVTCLLEDTDPFGKLYPPLPIVYPPMPITMVKSLTIHTNLRSYGPFGEKESENSDELFTSSIGTVIGFHGALLPNQGLLSLGVVIIPGATG